MVIAPYTIPSNNCLLLILSYTCGKEEAIVSQEYNRLCRRAHWFFKKSSTLNFFNMAPVKVVLNSWTEPSHFFKSKVYTLSKNHTIKLKMNVPLTNVSKVICEEEQSPSTRSDIMNRNERNSISSSEANFDNEVDCQIPTLEKLLVLYPKLVSLSLGYQRLIEPVILDSRPIQEAQTRLLKLSIHNSELDFSIVPFLTQQRGCLRELILTGNTFYQMDEDVVTLEIDNQGQTLMH